MTDASTLVKRALRRGALTRAQLAQRLGVREQSILAWEAGGHQPRPPTREKLARLASGRGPSRAARPRKQKGHGAGTPAGLPAAIRSAPVASPPSSAGSGGTGLEAARLSGWPCHANERADFYHRLRFVPDDVSLWRRRLAAHLAGEPARFPAAAGLDRRATLARLNEGIVRLREVARLLAALHGSPSLGNMEDPVDELVYIILSRKTRERAYQQTFAVLKRRFSTWDALLRARPRTVERLIRSGGLSGKKTQSLFGALGQLREAFGSCTLDPTRDWDDERLEQFLCGLPEISRKSAYCIMMYALGRAVFPVDTHVGRILARLDPYRELGLDLGHLDHKKKQAVLADLVPPNLRHGLHVNLIAHGREVCTAQRPRCDACEVRKFCGFHRQASQARAATLEAPTVIDLFSGAGGMSLGFGRAGFRLEVALDSDVGALRTLRLNHPQLPDERALCEDIRELDVRTLRRLLGRRRLDVLAGAPPCQGFSNAGFRSRATLRRGHRAMGDKRNYLYEPMLDVALALRPQLVLMENVPGMVSARSNEGRFFTVARELLEGGGYRTEEWKLNAAAFGVPQHRLRHFLVAARTARFPMRPEAEYGDAHGTFDDEALPPIRLDEAIQDLPPREADSGEGAVAWPGNGQSGERPRRRYLEKFGIVSGARVLYNHTVRYHNPRDLELYGLLRPGENSHDAIETYGRDDLMRYRRDGFEDKYNRLPPDRPSKTIVSHLAKDGNGYIHPTQPRSISIREAARLQSFPDEYAFCGSSSDQWVQLGNAVPPILAEAIAKSFMRCLR